MELFKNKNKQENEVQSSHSQSFSDLISAYYLNSLRQSCVCCSCVKLHHVWIHLYGINV